MSTQARLAVPRHLEGGAARFHSHLEHTAVVPSFANARHDVMGGQ